MQMLWRRLQCTAIPKLHPVHIINAARCRVTVNLWTKLMYFFSHRQLQGGQKTWHFTFVHIFANY